MVTCNKGLRKDIKSNNKGVLDYARNLMQDTGGRYSTYRKTAVFGRCVKNYSP